MRAVEIGSLTSLNQSRITVTGTGIRQPLSSRATLCQRRKAMRSMRDARNYLPLGAQTMNAVRKACKQVRLALTGLTLLIISIAELINGHSVAQAAQLNVVAPLFNYNFQRTALNTARNKLYYLSWPGYSEVDEIDLTTKKTSILWSFRKNSNILINPVTNRIYVQSNVLTEFDGNTYARRTVSIPENSSVFGLDTLSNQIFVADYYTGVFTQIDGETLTVVGQTTLAHRYPLGLVVNPTDSTIYIVFQPTEGDTKFVTQIRSTFTRGLHGAASKATFAVADIPLGSQARPLSLVNPITNKIYVRTDAGLTEVDSTTGQTHVFPGVDGTILPGIDGITLDLNPVTNMIYAASGGALLAVDCAKRTVETINVAPNDIITLQINRVANKILAKSYTNIYIVDAQTKSIVTLPIVTPQGPAGQDLTTLLFLNPVTNQTFASISQGRSTAWLAEIVAPPGAAETTEITQSIQDLQQSTPVIAGKSALVRVYLKPFDFTTVSGVLTLFRDGAAPVSLQSVAPMAKTMDDLATRRADLAKSLNFVVPANLAIAGRTRAELTSISWNNGKSRTFAAGECDGCSRVVTFQPPVEMRLRAVGVEYRLQASGVVFPYQKPRDVDFDLLQSWLQRAYPVSTLTFSRSSLTLTPDPYVSNQLFGCEVVNMQLTQKRNTEIAAGRDARTHYYGLVYAEYPFNPSANGNLFMGGCAAGIPTSPDPSTVASGPTGPPNSALTGLLGWDKDASWGDWYGGHELGHTLGRQHAGPVGGTSSTGDEYGPCGQYSSDTRCVAPPWPCNVSAGPDHNYPSPASQLSGSNQMEVGFDSGDSAHSIPSKALPGAMWHDVMSYCDYQWLSDYTYSAILTRLRAENALPASPSPPPAASGPVAARVAANEVSFFRQGDFITIVGTANITQKTAVIGFVRRVAQANVRPAGPDSPVRLRVIDKSGRSSETPAPFLPNSQRNPGEDLRGVVDIAIPARADIKAVELIIDNAVAARYEAPETVRLDETSLTVAKPPQTAMTKPDQRSVHLDWGNQKLMASASGAVRYDVQASGDGGRTWGALAIGLTTPSADVDLSEFSHDPTVDIRVIATAGFESKQISKAQIQK